MCERVLEDEEVASPGGTVRGCGVLEPHPALLCCVPPTLLLRSGMPSPSAPSPGWGHPTSCPSQLVVPRGLHQTPGFLSS